MNLFPNVQCTNCDKLGTVIKVSPNEGKDCKCPHCGHLMQCLMMTDDNRLIAKTYDEMIAIAKKSKN